MSAAAARACSAASCFGTPTFTTSLCAALIEPMPFDPTTTTTTSPMPRSAKHIESFLAIDKLLKRPTKP